MTLAARCSGEPPSWGHHPGSLAFVATIERLSANGFLPTRAHMGLLLVFGSHDLVHHRLLHSPQGPALMDAWSQGAEAAFASSGGLREALSRSVSDVMRGCTDSCAAPGCSGPGRLRCGGCRLVAYCGKECQKAAWKRHRPACRRAPPPAAGDGGEDRSNF